jgi:hypothetical protein
VFSQFASPAIGCIKRAMWETIQSSALWGNAGTGVAWVVTACLLIAGAIGCVLPVLPGHLILLIAAIGHRLMLGAEGSGLYWWSFVILGVLMAISQTLEMVSGAAGAKWFGGVCRSPDGRSPRKRWLRSGWGSPDTTGQRAS